MDTNDEIRLQRLRQLCRETEGGVRAVAKRAKVKNWQTLDQIIKRVELPTKKDGSTSKRNLGTWLARQIEAELGLGEGWFDWPFEGVDFKQWKALNTVQRAHVEGRLSEAIAAAARINPSGDALDTNLLLPNEAPQPTPTATKKPQHQ